MNKVVDFIKKEIVFVVSVVLAIFSAFVVKPSLNYLDYIDFRTLALLLALMLVVQGFKMCGLFDTLVRELIKRVSTKRQLATTLIYLCFFSSMLITNDVALITFVPFSIMILDYINDSKYSIYLIVLETIAANLGSMFTPIGNPQNLYLYSISEISIGAFLKLMLPYTAVSFFLLTICIFFIKDDKLKITKNISESDTESKENVGNISSSVQLTIYSILFLICILTVLHLLDYKVMLLLVLIAIMVVNIRLIKKADYILLLTFVFFFIFIGNIKNIPSVSSFLSELVQNNECLISVLASQVVSNVPAAMLLSGFTDKFNLLIIGTNIGGLGTLIASMASLISFKFYANTKESTTQKYILTFSLLNIIFLIVLLPMALILN